MDLSTPNKMYVSTHAATAQVLATQMPQNKAAFEQQLQHLRLSQQTWSELKVTERCSQLLQLAGRIDENKLALAQAVCLEVGRCLRECEAEIDKTVDLIRYYAKLAPELLDAKTITTQASLSQVRFEALGVVLAVMPWNYPVWQIMRFAIPALCSGNACVVKPAPSVAKVTQQLMDLVGVDIPLQAAYLHHDDVEYAIAATDALAFTGSTDTGRHLASLAGKHIKKCVLELGGSNAFIVLDDADIAQAAHDVVYSRFRDAGQSCNAAKRLIVTPAVADKVVEEVVRLSQQLVMGDPMQASTTLAPLHTQALQQKAHAQVQDALQSGAKLRCGGFVPETDGYFYPATVLDEVNSHCRVYHEEVFAPVLSVLRAQDSQHAIDLANDTCFGLGASVYSADTEQAWALAKRLQAGSVFINRHTSSDLRLPFGGIKQSGFGRELSEFGLYEFVNVKTYWQK